VHRDPAERESRLLLKRMIKTMSAAKKEKKEIVETFSSPHKEWPWRIALSFTDK
jgi:hypothetical protein